MATKKKKAPARTVRAKPARAKPAPELTRGQRVIAFVEKYCRVPEGDHVGEPMHLEEFERRFILDVYDNPHRTRRAYLSIAKKNGKTTLIAALVLVHVVGPEARRNTQVVSGAQSKEQAGLLFNLAVKMVYLSPQLTKLVRVSMSVKVMYGLPRNVEYKALAAEGKTTQGISPVVAILDEIGQVEGPRDTFVSAVVTSQGAYEDALLVAISTQASTDYDLFSIWLDSQTAAPDPRVVSHVYTAPVKCALDDPAAWRAANPGLGKFRSESDIAHAAKLAKLMPANEPEFRNFHLNQRVETVSSFITRAVWEANAGAPQPLDKRKVWGGLDLSSVNDLTALVLETEDGDLEAHFWLPKEGLLERSRTDRVPYDLWEQQGYLHTTPGRAIEYEYVANELRKVFDRCDVQSIGFDRYNITHLKPWLVKANFTDAEIAKFIAFGQGTASMTPALRALEVRLLNGKLRHGNHPLLNMCAANAVVVGESGARKFDKARARGRIDGMVALAMAEGVMPQQEDKPPPKKYQVLVL
jgi:phage terminase large subunit-like protein